jgi:ribose 1,5-bisphosphokinase PhnN
MPKQKANPSADKSVAVEEEKKAEILRRKDTERKREERQDVINRCWDSIRRLAKKQLEEARDSWELTIDGAYTIQMRHFAAAIDKFKVNNRLGWDDSWEPILLNRAEKYCLKSKDS